MNIFLSAHTIRVNRKKTRKEQESDKPNYRVLSKFNGTDDFFDVVAKFLNHLMDRGTDANRKTYMKTTDGKVDGRIISGKVESGVYGIASKIRNVKTDSIAYEKGEDDADVLPFYFLIYIPNGKEDEGILILQRTGNHGIQMRFNGYINDYIDDKFPGLSVEINSLIDVDKIKDDLRRGVVKKVRCVRFQSPSDGFDSLDEGHAEKSFNIEVSISSNFIPMRNKILRFLDTDMDVKSLIELRDFDFQYDTVKLEIDVDGTVRTVNLGDLGGSRSHYNITSKITKDDDNQPTFESIDREAKRYLNELIERVYP